MSDTIFHEAPSIELLQWLARGSLKQNLLRAVRLWVWLQFFYGEAKHRVDLDTAFTYADCRDAFFSPSHPRSEGAPPLHDAQCPCGKTTADWLFPGEQPLELGLWRRAFQQHQQLESTQAQDKLEGLLRQRPFAVTRRSLAADFQALVALGWLHHDEPYYRRVTRFPTLPVAKAISTASADPPLTLNLIQPDLAAIAHTLSHQNDGSSRFFLHLDYVVPRNAIDSVEDRLEILKQLWNESPIRPVKLAYHSASRQCQRFEVVYPVCVYYAQRAVYLCGFNPQLEHGWYNYRLDKVLHLTPVDWADSVVPEGLYQHYRKHPLPTPEYVEQEIERVWGFDFYLPPQRLLLRFERDFHDRYVKETVRHETFQPISYGQACRLIQQHTQASEQQTLLAVLQLRSPQDAYYQAYYRQGDPNIRQRLRAWRPYGEVLLPWDLRQEMATEVEREFQFYHPH